MSETPTDRVELTDARCGYTVTDVDGNEEPCDLPATGHRWYQDVGEHEDLLDVACDNHRNEGGRLIASLRADLQALTAERDRLQKDVETLTHDNATVGVLNYIAEKQKSERESTTYIHKLQAEVAAANTRCAELEASAQQEYDWQQKRTDEFTGTLSNVVASSEAELILLRDQNAALQATLDRVTAVADQWQRESGGAVHPDGWLDRFRAALTPEGTE